MVASSAPVTSIFAGIYVLMYALLSLRVALNRLYINFKGKKDVYLDVLAANAGEGLSDEEKITLNKWVRTHANFMEYIPLCIILTLLLEFNDAPRYAIYVPNIILIFARVIHVIGLTGLFSSGSSANIWRVGGFVLTAFFIIYAGIYVLVRGIEDY